MRLLPLQMLMAPQQLLAQIPPLLMLAQLQIPPIETLMLLLL
jgi:hypothetical protein